MNHNEVTGSPYTVSLGKKTVSLTIRFYLEINNIIHEPCDKK